MSDSYNLMKSLEHDFPEAIKLITIGNSVEGRPIQVVQLDYTPETKEKAEAPEPKVKEVSGKKESSLVQEDDDVLVDGAMENVHAYEKETDLINAKKEGNLM